jgi:hypothetical protein
MKKRSIKSIKGVKVEKDKKGKGRRGEKAKSGLSKGYLFIFPFCPLFFLESHDF